MLPASRTPATSWPSQRLGAYYFSNHFSYNLLPRIPVYGYFGDDEQQYALLRRGQTTEEVLSRSLHLRESDRLAPQYLNKENEVSNEALPDTPVQKEVVQRV
jgi:hypothetical protein